jgi:virulence-associated protein VagC
MTEARHVKLFRNGRNQAVRIPVEFELPGDEAIMRREGDRLVLEPTRKRGCREPSWLENFRFEIKKAMIRENIAFQYSHVSWLCLTA